jgi:hypothetical protein
MDARFASNVPHAQKSFWTHLMELLGDVDNVESRFGPFGDSVNVGARWVHSLHQMYYRLRNRIGHTQWNSLVTWVMWNLISIHLDTVSVSVQDRCMVCAKRTIGLEIVLDAPIGTAR